MSLKTYSISADTADGAVDSNKINQEIIDDASVNSFSGICINGNNLEIFGASLANETNLDAVIAAHVAVNLSEYKQVKYEAIDLKTGSLIIVGFVYDSKTFSLSANAQSNWNVLKDEEPEFTWPVEISTIDNDTYSLTAANLDAFWNAGKDAIKDHLDSGRAYKKSVYDAVDKAAVDAVVDTR